MIIPTKEVILIAPAEAKQLFLFDPKTACVIQKYSTESVMAPTTAYYQNGQQLIVSHLNNTYVNIWESDCQEPRKYSIGEGERITAMLMYEDTILYMGSASGNLLIFQIPSGVLIRRVALHSSEITNIHAGASGHLIISSTNQVKLWPLRDLLNEAIKPIPIKSIHSATAIIKFQIVCNILCIVSENSLRTFYADNLSQCEVLGEIPEIKNASCCCSSRESLYIGDEHGKIKEIPIAGNRQLVYDEKRENLGFEKRKWKEWDAKEPVSELCFVESLALLISGNCRGEVKIWNEKGLKNSMQLFKSAIVCLHAIPKPQNCEKIPQNQKITALHKQEMTKLQSPALVNSQPILASTPQPSNHHYLSLMLDFLNDPTEGLSAQVEVLREQNMKLLQANLHYGHLLDHSD